MSDSSRPALDGVLRAGLVITFLPLAWKAMGYVLLSSYVPLLVFLALGVVVVAGLRRGGRPAIRAVRIWCAAMIGWGVVRLLLLLLIRLADLSEAHLRSQLNVGFVALSAAYVAAGVVVWRRVGRRTPETAAPASGVSERSKTAPGTPTP